jgi:hypothetical protein
VDFGQSHWRAATDCVAEKVVWARHSFLFLTSADGYKGKWIRRCLHKLNFSDQNTIIAQKIDENWWSIATEGA